MRSRSADSCPFCQRPAREPPDRRLSSFEWLGARFTPGGPGCRELLCGAAALGLVVGIGVASEARICEQLGDTLEGDRQAALTEYFEARCSSGECQSIELVSTVDCRAKIRVIERRFDAYGDEIGLFRTDEGLEFSPMLERWRRRELLDEKQLLGFH